MRKITDKSELSELYSKVQNKLEEYVNDHKINVSELYEYVKNNIDEIIDECGLCEVVGGRQIVLDVVTHLRNHCLDKIMTFESFRRFHVRS